MPVLMQTLDHTTQPATTEPVTDDAITAAVEQLFLTQECLSAHLIVVTTQAGVVQLTGTADNLLARDRAEEIALSVRGVHSVVNEVLVGTPGVPDKELNHHLATALADTPATSGYGVRATAANGVVTVAGTVRSGAEQQLVLRVLRGVRGVRRLETDALVISWANIENSDEEITTQIRELLNWDIRMDSGLVQIRTYNRVVNLSGTVKSAAQKAQVVADASQAGARRVNANDLRITGN